MHHTMTADAPARTVTARRPAVAVKSDVRTGHDIAYVTRGHASGCTGAMAYYTRTGDPPGTWEGRGCAALGVSGTVEAEVAERLYQEGVGPGGERIIRHAAPKSGQDQAAAEAAALARYRAEHPFASASEINAERTRIRAISPGIARPYYDVTSSASKSVSVLHASLRVAAGQARETGDQVKAAALDGEAQAIEDALLDAVREGLELLEAMACYVRTGHHSATMGEWRDGKGLGSPALVASMLEACGTVGKRQGPRFRAFYGCMFYALMRPSEVAALTRDGCHLSQAGWGHLIFADSSPAAGKAYTDDGQVHEHRGLKGRTKGRPGPRARRPVRKVPIPPELVELLRTHLATFGVAPDGRLFRSENGNPLQPSTWWQVWQKVRAASLTPEQLASPLMKRPYDLRHSGVTWRLNSGVPATEVAAWAGHSVEVLTRVYARCVVGLEGVWIGRMDEALHLGEDR
jgi:integrase